MLKYCYTLLFMFNRYLCRYMIVDNSFIITGNASDLPGGKFTWSMHFNIAPSDSMQ